MHLDFHRHQHFSMEALAWPAIMVDSECIGYQSVLPAPVLAHLQRARVNQHPTVGEDIASMEPWDFLSVNRHLEIGQALLCIHQNAIILTAINHYLQEARCMVRVGRDEQEIIDEPQE